jgi:hypothetical protein
VEFVHLWGLFDSVDKWEFVSQTLTKCCLRALR